MNKTYIKQLRIAFVCAEYSYDGRPTGGFGSYVGNIAQSLVKLGHSITIICQGNENNHIKFQGLEIYIVKKIFSFRNGIFNLFPFSVIKRVCQFIEYPFLFSYFSAALLTQLNAKSKFDIIEGGDFAGELFFYLLKRRGAFPKVIIKLHTPSFLIRKYSRETRNLFYFIIEKIEMYCLRRVDAVYSPTDSLAQIIEKKYLVNVPAIIPYPIRKNMPLHTNNAQSKIILYVGKIQSKKGVFVLAQAIPAILKAVPDAKIYFIGPDTKENGNSTKEQLMNMLTENTIKKNVAFYSAMNKPELYKKYKKAAITVIPSLWENFPNVLLEAGMSGSAIVASDAGGIKEMIINGRTGILVVPNDSRQLADGITNLLLHSNIRRKLAKNLRNSLMKSYDPLKIGLATVNFYGKILTG